MGDLQQVLQSLQELHGKVDRLLAADTNTAAAAALTSSKKRPADVQLTKGTTATPASSTSPGSDDKRAKTGAGFDANGVLALSAKRNVRISEFKGRSFVNIREYYEANGELKPGKKGVALSKEAWQAVSKHMGTITEALSTLDESFQLDLGGAKKARVSSFKGTSYVNLREWYGDANEKPGKGISLNSDQWQKLVAGKADIDKAILG